MRPSIMSLGATTSAPARACDSACFTSASTVSSFMTYPVSSTRPSWPWLVYGSSATSVITPRPGKRCFSARTARWHRPSSSQAACAVSDLASGAVTGNSASAGIFSSLACSATRSSSSIDRRSMPGIEPTGARPAASCTNTG